MLVSALSKLFIILPDKFFFKSYFMVVFSFYNSVVKYEMQNLEVPTIHVLGELAKSGIRVLVYRYIKLEVI